MPPGQARVWLPTTTGGAVPAQLAGISNSISSRPAATLQWVTDPSMQQLEVISNSACVCWSAKAEAGTFCCLADTSARPLKTCACSRPATRIAGRYATRQTRHKLLQSHQQIVLRNSMHPGTGMRRSTHLSHTPSQGFEPEHAPPR